MLGYLHIKNFALLNELKVEFDKGLNVITGETGAGKSMVIEAINVILGAPVRQSWIKDDGDAVEVEALFFLDLLSKKQLQELEELVQNPLQEKQLIIRREVLKNRRSRCFINNQLTTISLLQEIGNYLIDIHGQHSHQSLLKPETHIDFVDSFGNKSFRDLKEMLASRYKQWQVNKNKLCEIIKNYSETLSKKDYLCFQLKEIEGAKLKPGEDQELEEILNVISHKAKIKEIMENAYEILFENTNSSNISAYDLLTNTITNFINIQGLDQNIDNIKRQLSDTQIKIEDIASQIMEYKDKIDLDVFQLQEVEERLNQINQLKHKYRINIEEIIKYGEQVKDQLASIELDETNIEKLKREIEEDEKDLIQLSSNISYQRKQILKQLEKDIVMELSELNMKDCNFIINIEQQEDKKGLLIDSKRIKITAKGIDHIEFTISTNFGENAKPLAEIVSGGEVSRIMLALKTILSKADMIPTMIFDEIDSGVGARLGEVIAQKLYKISENHQVIAISHLPQIACKADQHLYINKHVIKNEVVVTVEKLSGNKQICEIARMLDGEKFGSISIEHAKKMLFQKSPQKR